jgi:sugar lactone lactonase YvrE
MVAAIGVATTLAPGTPATAAGPKLELVRTIRTTPFAGTSTRASDNEGSAYVPADDSLWLLDDNDGRAYEVNPATGALKNVIANSEFAAARPLGGGSAAGTKRADDLEGMAYDPAADVLYAFSGPCCKSSVKPTVFRLTRSANRKFHVESFQPLSSKSDFTAAAVHPSDGKLYVGVHSNFWSYSYATNKVSSAFEISGVSGVEGMSFSADGAALYAVSRSKLYRVDWSKKKVVAGWVFDLGHFGIKDSRAVEVAGNELYVSDGNDKVSSKNPLRYAVYVFTPDTD